MVVCIIFESNKFIAYFCFPIYISEGDPDNFLTYFKRATVFLAMGRSKAALPDLDRVLELRPDFFQVGYFPGLEGGKDGDPIYTVPFFLSFKSM